MAPPEWPDYGRLARQRRLGYNITMTIDMHTHIYDEASLRAYFQACGGRVTKLLTFPFVRDVPGLKGLAVALAFTARHENVFAVGTFDMDAPLAPQLREVRTLFEEKRIVGVKLYPGYQHFYPHDPAVDAIAELCAESGKPLIFHGGLTHADVKGTLLKYSRPGHVDDIAVRHPRTNFIICHFGFPHYMETAAVLSDNDNVYADLSGIVDGAPGEPLEAMLRQHMSDLKRVFTYFCSSPDIRKKVLFGSDFIGGDDTMNYVEPYFRLVDELFEPQARQNVYQGLSERLFFS
jgi:uncharacterized protein